MVSARQRLAAALTTIAIFGLTSPAVAAPGDLIEVAAPALTTAGALAADPARGVYWTANSTGAEVFAIRPDGSLAGTVSYDAAPTNVEGLAVFNGQVYIGDVGDPDRSRAQITVYRLEASNFGESAPFSQWTLSYPDGPHDAATMMVSPRGNIWIVTKESPAHLYYLQAPQESGAYTLEYVAPAPDWVTDGTFVGPTEIALRTYTGLISIEMSGYTVIGQAPAPIQPQGESLTVTLDGRGLLLGSKGSQELVEAALPLGIQPLPDAPSVPPGGPTTEPPASAEPSAPPSATTAPQRRDGPGGSKSLVALLLAVTLSVGAGIFVYLRTRPGRV